MLKLRQPSVHYTGARQCLWVTVCTYVGVWERWVTHRDDSSGVYIPYKFNSGYILSVPVRKFVLRFIRSFPFWFFFVFFFPLVKDESMSWDISNIGVTEELFINLQANDRTVNNESSEKEFVSLFAWVCSDVFADICLSRFKTVNVTLQFWGKTQIPKNTLKSGRIHRKVYSAATI